MFHCFVRPLNQPTPGHPFGKLLVAAIQTDPPARRGLCQTVEPCGFGRFEVWACEFNSKTREFLGIPTDFKSPQRPISMPEVVGDSHGAHGLPESAESFPWAHAHIEPGVQRQPGREP